MLTWILAFQEKLLYLMVFSLYSSLFWELRDKRNFKKIHFWPDCLGAISKYWYIERGQTQSHVCARHFFCTQVLFLTRLPARITVCFMQARIQGRWNGWIFTPFFRAPFFLFFSYPSYIEIIFQFSDAFPRKMSPLNVQASSHPIGMPVLEH